MPILGHEEIEHRFGFRPANEKTAEKHKKIRAGFIELAKLLDDLILPNRAGFMALDALEETAMWANKSASEDAPLEPRD